MQSFQLTHQRRRKAVSLNIPSHPFSLFCREGTIIPSLTEIILDAFSRFDENFSSLSQSQEPLPLPPLLATKLLQVVSNNPNATDIDLNIIMYRLLASGVNTITLDIHNTHLLTRSTCLNIFQLSLSLHITTLDISFARGCSSDELGIMCKNFPYLKHLNASGCLPFDDFCLLAILQSSPPLETLNVSNCSRITDYGIQNILNVNTLRIFKANNTLLTSKGLQYLHDLIELELLNCKNLTDECLSILSKRNSHLSSLSISSQRLTDKSIQSFLQKIPELTYLNLTNCVNAGILTLSQLFHSKFKLNNLNLSNCFGVSGEHLMRSYNQLYASSLFSWLADLIYLNISGCTRISTYFLTNILQNTPNLKTLILDGLIVDEPSIQSFLQSSCVAANVTRRSVVRKGGKFSPLTLSFKQCKMNEQTLINFFTVRGCDLISLNLNSCLALTTIALTVLGDNAHSLTHFYCTNNTTLTETALIQFIYRSPRLRVLFLSNTTAVTNRVILAVRDSCLNLSHFDISGCENITPDCGIILSGIHSLQYLDISFTPFTPNQIQFIINALPRITSFSMQGVTYSAPQLFSQEAQWMNVMRLNFSQCSDALLSNISDFCPLLTTVELRMCVNVTDSGIQMLLNKCTKLLNIVLTGTSVSQQVIRFLSSKGVSIL
ncbi:EIN3-binding F-box protein, putative [Entamoeba dispar SAW760]|uniref:EIN3-binding F-box protein, putative n=1 Tax=Entamoeba dispar (strain ATCC PRA-260 / SAW760) TaxID=370354 RepID=B0EMG3_ENTDS|nr:EIN3-binding F-box protein, putative [Entamoeba dispar SAW760]EDR24286.1 EIN3-binding F-box protein, putative [Entamoeba dispar SAW760]|eukprot:EDR24286.1 EIN3-binding F-box protein, putative [Entamoeba dispar SAW760]